MCGLGGSEANRMKSQALNIPNTSLLTESYSSRDISLGNKEEGSLLFDEAVRYYQHVLIFFHL